MLYSVTSVTYTYRITVLDSRHNKSVQIDNFINNVRLYENGDIESTIKNPEIFKELRKSVGKLFFNKYGT